MDNYIKTIINGLKAWVTSCLNRLESSVNTLSTRVTKAKTTAETAKTTANTAKTTAETAQTTANTAKTTAETAQTTANTAQSTANTAQTTANTAKTTANTAKTTAETAKTTAETAQTTANTAKTTANVKWGSAMFAFLYDVGASGESITTGMSYGALPTGTTYVEIYALVGSIRGTSTSVSGITGVKLETSYATFNETVTVDQFDVIKIYRNNGETQWRAAKTGINLGANALVTALSEVYEE